MLMKNSKKDFIQGYCNRVMTYNREEGLNSTPVKQEAGNFLKFWVELEERVETLISGFL